MTAAAETDTLPAVFDGIRGKISRNHGLGARTWFRVGGPAEYYVQPADTDDLARLMRQLTHEWPVTILGACSNVIIRDGGIRGIVIRLARGFADITPDGEDALIAGAAALDVTIAETAASHGIAGLEFLVGIPGSLGGAVFMNAGAYGSDISHILDWVEIIDGSGSLRRLTAAEAGLSYRTSRLPPGAIVIRARLRGTAGDPAGITARMNAIRSAREDSQPVRARTGGSTFRNPAPDESSLSAWQLVDAAGCRGLQNGGAQVSEKHCNFLINTGDATAADLETLGDLVREKVRAASGVDLHWEIRRLGLPASAGTSSP
ncbi:UDP-N-acetylmuramate dehydrogenase [Acetobacter sp. AN02]|uniref:UDP-N-acetylmuramate dehydrogenase n=1 Tax=Acetobacter sp. AN02 TaxID=2894186 RepID=UPI0024343923|nr:UDP-N-acetylmuramate dehydrogenase [Acetobacter sp. AN02]MDG6094217.1 UDP-N-acetylmuramate dehydrogenase [Acetobacter sp. AN02]